MSILTSKREITVLPATHTSTNGMSHPAFDAEPQHINALWPVLVRYVQFTPPDATKLDSFDSIGVVIRQCE